MRINHTVTIAILISVSAGAAAAQNATSRIVSAANQFLGTLDDRQRQSVQFAYNDEEQRKRWSNLPVSIVPRAGLSIGELNPAQRAAAMTLVSSALSQRGFEKIQQIMAADEVLKNTDGRGGPGGRGRGGPPNGRGRGGGGGLMFGSDLYYVSLLGAPSEKTPWMLQFGGHHLALNITIDGDRGILTPTLTGAQPALYTANGKTVRPLGQESDKAVALLNALDESQRKQAVLSFRLADLVLGPGQDGKTIQPEGLKASGMNEKQRALLLDVISEWAGIIHDSAAARRMAELKAEINETWFAWSGPTDVTPGTNIASYYRIQGPHLVIEYAPQQMGGDASNHIHTMYRDPTNDYGRKPGAK
jgi:hypothetical protein